MIIDRNKKEFRDCPEAVDGHVLLERTADGGYLTIEPGYLKHIAKSTKKKLKEMGYDKYQDKIDAIKGMKNVKAVDPFA